MNRVGAQDETGRTWLQPIVTEALRQSLDDVKSKSSEDAAQIQKLDERIAQQIPPRQTFSTSACEHQSSKLEGAKAIALTKQSHHLTDFKKAEIQAASITNALSTTNALSRDDNAGQSQEETHPATAQAPSAPRKGAAVTHGSEVDSQEPDSSFIVHHANCADSPVPAQSEHIQHETSPLSALKQSADGTSCAPDFQDDRRLADSWAENQVNFVHLSSQSPFLQSKHQLTEDDDAEQSGGRAVPAPACRVAEREVQNVHKCIFILLS